MAINCTVKPPIKDTRRKYTVYRKSPLKEDNLSTKDKTADPKGVLLSYMDWNLGRPPPPPPTTNRHVPVHEEPVDVVPEPELALRSPPHFKLPTLTHHPHMLLHHLPHLTHTLVPQCRGH